MSRKRAGAVPARLRGSSDYWGVVGASFFFVLSSVIFFIFRRVAGDLVEVPDALVKVLGVSEGKPDALQDGDEFLVRHIFIPPCGFHWVTAFLSGLSPSDIYIIS